MSLLRTGCWLVLAALALGACDGTEPRPARVNPYDPAYSGTRRLTPPGALTVTDLTATSATLRWTDASSFEAGYIVEQAPDGSSTFETLARLPPDTQHYTVAGLTTAHVRAYRVRAAGSGELDSPPTAAVVLHPPVHVRPIPSTSTGVYAFDPQGRWLHVTAGGLPQAVALPVNQPFVTLEGSPPGPVRGFTLDGRAIVRTEVETSTDTSQSVRETLVAFYEGARRVDAVAWTQRAVACQPHVPPQLWVSADAQRVALRCIRRTDGEMVLLTAPLRGAAGEATVLPLPGGVRQSAALLSADGRAWYPYGPSFVRAYDSATLAPRWSYAVVSGRIEDRGAAVQSTADGSRLVLSTGEHLVVLDAASGAVVATRTLPGVFDVQHVSVYGVTLASRSGGSTPSAVLALRFPDLQPDRLLPGTYRASVVTETGLVAVAETPTSFRVVSWDFSAPWRLTPLL